MWISKDWKDFEILDASDGERLERWGSYILVRPDPQVIWNTPRTDPRWQRCDAKYERAASGGGRWLAHQLPETWQISYHSLTFCLKAMNFKHTGVFPEQAVNWDFITRAVQGAERPVSVLNLFAYTGGATLAAAAGGANVCHVDAAKGMVQVARQNAAASGLEQAPIRWIIDDCAKFVEREIRRGRRYDAIIMDPPSYGRGPSGEIWKLVRDLYPFLQLVSGVLSEQPLFVLVNSYTTGLAPSVVSYLLDTILRPRFGGRTQSGELGLPVTQSGLVLPCGATGRWLSPALAQQEMGSAYV